jgi:hypothetical protein
MNNDITYLSFNAVDFANVIAFVKSMGSKRTILLMQNEGNDLVCRACDDSNNYFIEYHVELCDGPNNINEQIAIPVNDLIALTKYPCQNDKISIRKCFNQFEMNVIGDGWLPFRTVEFNSDKFKFSSDEIEIGKINSLKLKNVITYALSYTQEYTYVRDMYITFTKSKMTATYRQSSFTTIGDFVDMTLHRDVAIMLKTLLKSNFDLEIKSIKDNLVERTVFIGPKFKLISTTSELDNKVNNEYIENIANYITVNCDMLYKLAVFSEEYSASKHILGVLFKNNKLNVSLKNILAAKHMSTIDVSVVGDVKDMTKEAEIPSHGLLKALKLFQEKHVENVNIYITDDMVDNQHSFIIFDEDTQATINIYNR